MGNYQKVAAHAFIKRDGKFLVTKRSPQNDYKPNEWDIPGGTIEFGETPEEALKREVLEEVGLVINILRPLFVYSFMSNPQRHQFQIVYECEYVSGEVKLNPEEHDDYTWAEIKDLDDLPKIAFLEAFLKNLKLEIE